MILTRADQLPPFICRLIARKRVMTDGHSRFVPMSHADIAAVSDLPRSTISDLSRRHSWTGVRIEVIDAFTRGCGVDLTNPGRHIAWLKRNRAAHISAGNAHQRRFFTRLMAPNKAR